MAQDSSQFAQLLSIWAVFASTVGIFITHVLTRSWDRKKQHADYEKQEARELLTALYKILATYPPYAIMVSPLYGPHKSPDALKEADEKYLAATVEFYRTFNDRLYIADVVKAVRVKERWDAARDAFAKDIGDEPGLKAAVGSIRDDIVAAILGRNIPFLERAWNKLRFKRRRK
jgi:hypothetical protein